MDQAEPISQKRRAKFAVGGAVIAASLIALVAWAMSRPGTTAFYMTVTELHQSASGTRDYRVNGNVVPGSLERDGTRTTFAITDGEADLIVSTKQALPDAFWTAYEDDPDSVEVVAQGHYDGDTFAASQVLAKCPSKFKARA